MLYTPDRKNVGTTAAVTGAEAVVGIVSMFRLFIVLHIHVGISLRLVNEQRT